VFLLLRVEGLGRGSWRKVRWEEKSKLEEGKVGREKEHTMEWKRKEGKWKGEKVEWEQEGNAGGREVRKREGGPVGKEER
jgi:hypothetical protein